MSRRYRLICVAPFVADLPSTDSLDEAIVAVGSDHYGSYFDIYDTETGKYVPRPCSPEEVDEARERLAASAPTRQEGS